MTTRSRHSSRWLGLAAGTALTVASVGALAADPAAHYPSATPPYPSAEYQPIVQQPVIQPPPPGQTTVVTTTTTTYPSGARTVGVTPAPVPVPASPLSTPTYTYPVAATPTTVYPSTGYRPYVTVPPANAKAALREMQIAQEHAVYAVHAPTLEAAQTQMHAVINCIAGPNAAEFNPSVVNPCADIGAGALVDANDTSRLPYTREALQHARSGLQTNDLATVKRAAINTINALRLASM